MVLPEAASREGAAKQGGNADFYSVLVLLEA